MRQGFVFLDPFQKEHAKMKIHLIETANNFNKLREKIWECGWWKLEEDKAKKLIGGHIYFHKKRSEPSFYGGSIRGYRVKQEEPNQGKIIFEFEYHSACRGIKTDKTGWSIAKKIVQ
jgi:hypothetical protein